MPQLTPTQAALFARLVYKIKDNQINDPAANEGIPGFVRLKRFEGTAGAQVLGDRGSETTGFGFVARGAEGTNKGDLVIATRGTVVQDDWLTNFNIAIDEFTEGTGKVHSGFYGLFKTFKDEIDTWINFVQRPSALGTPINTIHVVGHSLGGALASINAYYIKKKLPTITVNLYTFGCPRVGDKDFVTDQTLTLGAERMRRVYHNADPVPMIPPWPFYHAPFVEETGLANFLSYGNGIPTVAAHLMTAYGPSVDGKSWEELDIEATQVLAATYLEQIRGYLKGQSMSEGMWGWVAAGQLKAFEYLAQAAYASMQLIGLRFTQGMTLLDQIAFLINSAKAGSLAQNVSFQRYISLISAFMTYSGERQTNWLSEQAESYLDPLNWLYTLVANSYKLALAGWKMFE